MRHYELVVVLSPMINPGQVTEAWDRIKGFITGREADINHEERWGTRRLAYPIRKGQYQFLEGNYHITRFSTEQPFNRELETFLRLDDNVLRSMVIATLPEDQLAAQAAAQARAVRTPPPRPVPAEGATPAAPATEAAAGPCGPCRSGNSGCRSACRRGNSGCRSARRRSSSGYRSGGPRRCRIGSGVRDRRGPRRRNGGTRNGGRAYRRSPARTYGGRRNARRRYSRRG